MESPAWLNGINVAITVCDREGGKALLGKKLWDCHPDAAREKIRRLMAADASNSYTIEKNGEKKLIHQAPWHENGELAGLVEFSMVIPQALPHFLRG
jgi:hypothetical protein